MGGVKLTIISALLFACKKQPGTSAENVESTLASQVSVKEPSVENGVLKFEDFRSFRYYKPATTLLQQGTVKAKTTGSFISMQTAFDSITKADALLAEQLEKQYPNGPSSVFDNTHTSLVGVFPNSIYVEGNENDGYWYESNCYDKKVTDKINKDGFVIVSDWLLQYSKDSLKIWLVGKSGLNGRFSSNSFFSANMHNNSSIENMRNNIYADNSRNVAAKSVLGWTLISSEVKETDCRNTQRINNRNRRVIGRIRYEVSFNPLAGNQYETSIDNQSRSLTGRLFGTWYDNWTTANEQFYNSQGAIQIVYPTGSYNNLAPYSFDINNPITFNWYWIDNRYNPSTTDWTVSTPVNTSFNPYQGYTVQSVVTIGNKASITLFQTRFKAYDGGSGPECTCEHLW